jgi:DNA-binding MarR family transcriptional regulator
MMALLYRQTDVGFAALRDALGATPGNLASHAARLEAAGLVESRDALTRGGFERRYQITAQGLAVFERYLATLESFVAASRSTPAPPQASVAPAPAPQGSRFARRATLAALGAGLAFVVTEATQRGLAHSGATGLLGIGLAGAMMAGVAFVQHVLAGGRGFVPGWFRRG